MEQLRKLDASVTIKATMWAVSIGVIVHLECAMFIRKRIMS